MGRYEILDNFLSFWFYFYDKNRTYIEQERFTELKKYFFDEFNGFIGRKFEKFVKQLIVDKILLSDLNIVKIGSQWGKSIGEAYEIDILAENYKNDLIFGECKWQENVNALEIAGKLEDKSKNVEWRNNEGKESFVIFAKSFSKKISEIKGKKVYCFDLKDIQRKVEKRSK